MKSTIIALTCVLTATACAAASNKPELKPASGYNSPDRANQDGSTAVASSTDRVEPTPNAAGGATTTTDRRDTWAEPGSVARSGGAPAAANNPGTPEQAKSPGTPEQAKSPGTPEQAKSPENTKVNERDRRSSALTPMDQGNSASETKISAAIRRGIMGDSTLSFTAKNVKIITVGTKVTLRGPVKSDQEKAAIEAHAKQTAGVSDVDNQLEVSK